MGNTDSTLMTSTDFKPIFQSKFPKNPTTKDRLKFIYGVLLDASSCHKYGGPYIAYIKDLFVVCKWPYGVRKELDECYNNIVKNCNSLTHKILELYIRQLCFLIGCEITSMEHRPIPSAPPPTTHPIPSAPPAQTHPPAYPLVIICPGCSAKKCIPTGTVITDDVQLYCETCNKHLLNWHCSKLGECGECSETMPVMQYKAKWGDDVNLCRACYAMTPK